MPPKTLLCLAACLLTVSCASKPPEYASPPGSSANQQPDKLLFDRAVGDIEHGRYETARLTLQTLVNTYPTSEYLPQAQLAIADTWYREGSVKALTQARSQCQQVMLQFPGTPPALQAAQLVIRIDQDLAKKGQPAK